jgi:hypothetical protein
MAKTNIPPRSLSAFFCFLVIFIVNPNY